MSSIAAEEAVWKSHRTKDILGVYLVLLWVTVLAGRVVCPALASHTCGHCGATGEQAHTERYCPDKPLFVEVARGRRHSMC